MLPPVVCRLTISVGAALAATPPAAPVSLAPGVFSSLIFFLRPLLEVEGACELTAAAPLAVEADGNVSILRFLASSSEDSVASLSEELFSGFS